MLDRVTCPHCGSALRLPEAAASMVVVCPRCRGRFPNPTMPESGSAAGVDSWPAVTAIDDEVRPEVRRTRRQFGGATALLLLLVLLSGLVTGIVASRQGGWRQLDTAANSMGVTLLGFAGLAAPLMAMWIYRSRLSQADLARGTRIVLAIFLWLLASVVSVAAAGVIFFLACLGGMGAGEQLR